MAKEPYQEAKEQPAPSSPESDSLQTAIAEPYHNPEGNLVRRIIDGFKRNSNLHATPAGVVGANGQVYDVEAAAQATANSPLARKLKGRHLQMIAIGGSIGMLYFRIGQR